MLSLSSISLLIPTALSGMDEWSLPHPQPTEHQISVPTYLLPETTEDQIIHVFSPDQ